MPMTGPMPIGIEQGSLGYIDEDDAAAEIEIEQGSLVDLMAFKEAEGSMEATLPAAPVAVKHAPLPAEGGSKLKRRLTKGEIAAIIALKPEPFPSAYYLDDLAQFEPPETIAEKWRQHEADFGDRDDKFEPFRQQVIRGLKQDGYYEVDQDYLAGAGSRDKANQHARKPFAFLDPSDREGRFATPEDHQRRLRQGCIRQYIPDAEDALLISYGEDDDDSVVSHDEGDDDGSGEEEEDAEAQGHSSPPSC